MFLRKWMPVGAWHSGEKTMFWREIVFAGSFSAVMAGNVAVQAAPTPLHDYEFNGTLADSEGGPAITSEGGTVGASTYQFAAELPPGNYNPGLTLDSPGLTDGGVYSIEMRLRLNSIDNITYYKGFYQPFVKLIDFKNRTQDYGVYTEDVTDFSSTRTGPDGTVYYHGTTSILETYGAAEFNYGNPPNLVHPNQWFDFVITRDASQTVTMYFNGQEIFSFDDSIATGDGNMAFNGPNNPNQIMRFMQDDLISPNYGPPGGPVYETSSGEVDLIKIFNSALSPDDVASLMPLKGDINGDGHFNAADIPAFEKALADPTALGNWSVLGDFNGDGVVNNADLQAMILALQSGQGNSSSVPEPASCLLSLCGFVGFGALAIQRHQQRVGIE
jgi:hypothetical protein